MEYDENLVFLRSIKLPFLIKEGWGITFDLLRSNLAYISDGSSYIYLCDVLDNFKILKKIEVKYKNSNISQKLVNELQFIHGRIYANVYLSKFVVVIDPETGIIERKIDFSELVERAENMQSKLNMTALDRGECLNGIAYDRRNGHLIVTGKHWPLIFRVKLTNK